MRIHGGIPNHVARAYGIQRSAPPAPAQPVEKTSSAVSPAQAQQGGKINELIAGKVSGPVDFSTASSAVAHGSLQLYTRAADKMEAAVAVQIGRTLDIRG